MRRLLPGQSFFLTRRGQVSWPAAIAALLLSCTFCDLATGQESPDKLWKVLGENKGPANFTSPLHLGMPGVSLSLNGTAFAKVLRSTPTDTNTPEFAKGSRITLPAPDGSFITFQVLESSIFEEGSDNRGGLQTYRGIGIEDPTASARFESGPDGLHAIVRSGKGTFYVDPTDLSAPSKALKTYTSYFFTESRPVTGPGSQSGKKFNCVVTATTNEASGNLSRPVPGLAGLLDDSNLRVFRIAIAADSAYVSAVFDKSVPGDSKEQALRAVARTVNRVNEIYESELGIRLLLVKNEDQLIFSDPASDPFLKANNNANLALEVAQRTIDKTIGEGNYDIGHLFATGTAGLATVGSVCLPGLKARATTGISTPIGDAFDVDYVAHEIGHQFGANHTFNGTIDACGGNRRNPSTAYEPGSGSTIMSYTGPGLCGVESIQADSDPYFHIASLNEIATFLLDSSRGGSCGKKISIQNLDLPPAGTSLGLSFIIPKGTPFVLTPTVNFDRPLKFTWEEFDLGAPSPPDDASAVRPIFRSRRPELIGTRFFPSLETLTSTTSTTAFTGESLPQLSTTMKFRLTVRNGFGRFNFGDASITVDSGSGPFRLIQPAGGMAWSVGSSHTITWDVANTDQAPVNVKNLRVSVIPDGDLSREFTLVESVANTGTATFTVPLDAPISSSAVLKIAAVGSIFFSIAPQPLQIIPQ